MKVGNAIKERRSAKKFLKKKVSMQDLCSVADASRYAPMAGNIYSIRVVAVEDEKKKGDIAKCCAEQYFIQDAPYLLVVFSDPTRVRQMFKGMAKKYLRQQAGAAIQNMLLKATELELQSCWIGAFDDGVIKRVLRVPENIEVEAVIAIGYGRQERMPFKQSPDYCFFWNSYGKWQRHGGMEGVRDTAIAVRETEGER